MKKNNTPAEKKTDELELVSIAQKGGEKGLNALNELLLAGTRNREYWARRAYEANKGHADNASLEDYIQEAFLAERKWILSYDPSKETKLQTHRINGIRLSGRQLAKKEKLHSIRETSFSKVNENRKNGKSKDDDDSTLFEEVSDQDFREKRLVNNGAFDKRRQESKQLVNLVLQNMEQIKATNDGAVIKKRIERVKNIHQHFLQGGTKLSYSQLTGDSRTTMDKSFEAVFENLSQDVFEKGKEFLAA